MRPITEESTQPADRETYKRISTMVRHDLKYFPIGRKSPFMLSRDMLMLKVNKIYK